MDDEKVSNDECEDVELIEFIKLLEKTGIAEELRAHDMRGKNVMVNPHAVAKLKKIYDCVNKMVWKDEITSVVLKRSLVGSYASIVLTTAIFGTSKITFPLLKSVMMICDGVDICESILGDGIIQISFHVNDYLLEI